MYLKIPGIHLSTLCTRIISAKDASDSCPGASPIHSRHHRSNNSWWKHTVSTSFRKVVWKKKMEPENMNLLTFSMDTAKPRYRCKSTGWNLTLQPSNQFGKQTNTRKCGSLNMRPTFLCSSGPVLHKTSSLRTLQSAKIGLKNDFLYLFHCHHKYA